MRFLVVPWVPEFVLLLAVGVLGCGPGPTEQFDDGSKERGEKSLAGSTISLRGGTHSVGGRESLAALVTIRDAQGRGPVTPWSLIFKSATGEELARETYDDGSEGSFMAFWWPQISVDTEVYSVTAAVGGESASLPTTCSSPRRTSTCLAHPACLPP